MAIFSNRGRVFESSEIKSFLDFWNACKTRTTPFIRAGNGQGERLNGINWDIETLQLKQLHKPAELWDEKVAQALCKNMQHLSSRAVGFESPQNRLIRFTRPSLLDLNIIDIDKTDVRPPCSISTPKSMYQSPALFIRNSKDDTLVHAA